MTHLPRHTRIVNRPRRRGAVRRVVTVLGTAVSLIAILSALATGGCGIRFVTDLPIEPTPDTEETVRRSAVDDAMEIKDLAAQTVAPDAATHALLLEAQSFAVEHVAALGGVYDSGLGDLLGTPSATAAAGDGPPAEGDGPAAVGETASELAAGGAPASGSMTPGTTALAPGNPSTSPLPATTDGVIRAMIEAAGRTRGSVDITTNGNLAQKLASIAACDSLQAQRLAAATKSTRVEEPDPQATAVTSMPNGLSIVDLQVIVADEDAAGYMYERRAAKADGDVRDKALARAIVHRGRATMWALATGIADTDKDPRRIAYVLPDLSTEALAQSMETGLAESYLTLTAKAARGARGPLAWLGTDSAAAAVAWGGAITPFPGLSENASTSDLVPGSPGVAAPTLLGGAAPTPRPSPMPSPMPTPTPSAT